MSVTVTKLEGDDIPEHLRHPWSIGSPMPMATAAT